MSVLDKELADNLGYRPEKCFYCGKLVPQHVCIYWIPMDDNPMIFLHYECAALFASHLQSDFTRFLISVDIKRAVEERQ